MSKNELRNLAKELARKRQKEAPLAIKNFSYSGRFDLPLKNMGERALDRENNFLNLEDLYGAMHPNDQKIIRQIRAIIKEFLDKDVVDLKGLESALKDTRQNYF